MVSGQLQKTRDLDEFLTWACAIATWYWSVDTLFWQVSIYHSMDVQYQRSTQQTKVVCLWQPIICSMATMLRDSIAAVIVVVVRTHPQAILLAMRTMRKSTHGFLSLSYTCLSTGLRLAALWAAGALLLVQNLDFCSYNFHFSPFSLSGTCQGEVDVYRFFPNIVQIIMCIFLSQSLVTP